MIFYGEKAHKMCEKVQMKEGIWRVKAPDSQPSLWSFHGGHLNAMRTTYQNTSHGCISTRHNGIVKLSVYYLA